MAPGNKLAGIVLLLIMVAGRAEAAGGVIGEAGSCMMEIGIYTAHFSIFQPESSGGEVFCEDLPALGNTLFVMDYLHGSLSEVPVDFRIIRDVEKMGIFVRWKHIEAMTDLNERTMFYQPPVLRADNQLQVEHRFTEPGAYIGIVSAPHPSKNIVYRSVFPFRVAPPVSLRWWLLLLAALALLVYRWRRKS